MTENGAEETKTTSNYSTGKPGSVYIPEVSEADQKRSLRASIWEGSLYSSMVGFGEIYFVPLMLVIGASNFQVGIFTAIPQLCLAFSQFLSIFIIERLMIRKKIIFPAAAIQAIVMGVIFLELLSKDFSPVLFIALGAAYYTMIGLIIPAWNSLLGDLTYNENRGEYFGKRNGLAQLVAFIGLFIAGLTIQHYDASGNALKGFIIIIGIAFLSRFFSLFFFVQHYDVPYKKVEGSYFSFWDFIRRSPKSNFAHFVYFIGAMSFAVQIAAPFFAIYMLKELEFSYLKYIFQVGTFVATQFISMRFWGPYADRFGNRLVLKITGAIIPLIPVLWLFSSNYNYLLFLQMLSGIIWGGWALSTGNFVFDAVTPPKRARCAAYLNFFNSSGIFLGAMLGAILVKYLPDVINTSWIKIEFISPIQLLFLISTVVRFLVLVILNPTIHEVRDVSQPTARDTLYMITHIRPFSMIRFEPFTGMHKIDWKHILPRHDRHEKGDKNH
jgi:MFS family permease